MIRPKLVVVNTDRDERPGRSLREGRGYRFDLSWSRLLFCALGFTASLCFMFTLGVFVGRGIPVVSSDDLSIKGRFLRFMGLEKATGSSSPKAAATWEDPLKMLESLNYYEDLTHKEGTKRAAAPKNVVKEAAPAEKAFVSKNDKLQAAAEGSGKYTLLVASLKEPDAQALVEKLKAKGYSPRVESLDLGAARWDRILLGSFPTREAAVMFADEFNRKENLEALVTTGSDQRVRDTHSSR
jgi:hypothetical protein